MTVTQQGIVLLLKSAVLDQKFMLPEAFSLEEALPLIKKHSLTALCFSGALNCGISRQQPAMQSLFAAYCKGLQKSEMQIQQLHRLYEAFEHNGIDYMPLKGANMKCRYPKPEYRDMGDVDILIRTEQYHIIVPVMESLGFQEISESEHELVWQSSGLYLELHKRLIPSYNEDFYPYFEDGWKFARQGTGTRFDMTAEDEFIYLFSHFAKHFRDGGVGCRHVLDLWVYRKKEPALDEEYIFAVMEQLRLADFYRNVCRMLDVWFAASAPDEKTKIISDFVFSSGNWGSIDSQTLSRAVRDSGTMTGTVAGRLISLGKALFPPIRMLDGKYKILKKYPCLLPLIWFIRPFYKVIYEGPAMKRKMAAMNSISKEALLQRRQLLKSVGLEYHF